MLVQVRLYDTVCVCVLFSIFLRPQSLPYFNTSYFFVLELWTLCVFDRIVFVLVYLMRGAPSRSCLVTNTHTHTLMLAYYTLGHIIEGIVHHASRALYLAAKGRDVMVTSYCVWSTRAKAKGKPWKNVK